MNVNEVIESYVRDVAACLPRDKRNDVALELRALLHEELAGRAEAAGRAPDRELAMALLKDFGRPAEAAQRYHARSALVEPADRHHFLIWAVGGAIVLVMHALLGNEIDLGALFLQWLGILLLFFMFAGWWRRRRPDVFSWKPTRGLEWMPRSLSALSLVCMLVFPVAMYAAPQAFGSMLVPSTVSVDGLALTSGFVDSWQRMLTLGLLVGMALGHGISLVIGSRPRWLRRCELVLNFAVGGMLIAHASPMSGFDGQVYSVFASAYTNETAAPIFLGVGGMMILVALYYGWRERQSVAPDDAGGLHAQKG